MLRRLAHVAGVPAPALQLASCPQRGINQGEIAMLDKAIRIARSLKGASFTKAEDGTIAVIFALTATVCVGVTGLAVDYGRAVQVNTKIAAAADAAALAAAKAMRDAGATDAQANAIALQFFHENMKGSADSIATINGINVTIDHHKNSVTVDVNASVDTVLGKIAGVTKISMPKSAAAIYDSKDIELGLQLDVTGSMAGQKLQDLKDAVAGHNGLLDIMLPSSGSTNKVRIGYAPFAAGVNAGDYALDVSDRRATTGCVYERHNLLDQPSDALPVGPVLSLRAKSEIGRNPIDCPRDAKVVAMTNDAMLLRNTINSWNVSTSTAGHLGTAWAWYLLSPEWASIWPSAAKPAAYSDHNTKKVAILMTDGIYNTVGGQSDGDYGNSAAQSVRIALDTCTAMKAKGITVYTIGFQAPTDAKRTLTDCASDPSKFYDAKDGAILRASFRAIANEINNLRLSR